MTASPRRVEVATARGIPSVCKRSSSTKRPGIGWIAVSIRASKRSRASISSAVGDSSSPAISTSAGPAMAAGRPIIAAIISRVNVFPRSASSSEATRKKRASVSKIRPSMSKATARMGAESVLMGRIYAGNRVEEGRLNIVTSSGGGRAGRSSRRSKVAGRLTRGVVRGRVEHRGSVTTRLNDPASLPEGSARCIANTTPTTCSTCEPTPSRPPARMTITTGNTSRSTSGSICSRHCSGP